MSTRKSLEERWTRQQMRSAEEARTSPQSHSARRHCPPRCLLSIVSCLLSLVSCLLSLVFCLLSLVSCLLSDFAKTTNLSGSRGTGDWGMPEHRECTQSQLSTESSSYIEEIRSFATTFTVWGLQSGFCSLGSDVWDRPQDSDLGYL